MDRNSRLDPSIRNREEERCIQIPNRHWLSRENDFHTDQSVERSLGLDLGIVGDLIGLRSKHAQDQTSKNLGMPSECLSIVPKPFSPLAENRLLLLV